SDLKYTQTDTDKNVRHVLHTRHAGTHTHIHTDIFIDTHNLSVYPSLTQIQTVMERDIVRPVPHIPTHTQTQAPLPHTHTHTYIRIQTHTHTDTFTLTDTHT